MPKGGESNPWVRSPKVTGEEGKKDDSKEKEKERQVEKEEAKGGLGGWQGKGNEDPKVMPTLHPRRAWHTPLLEGLIPAPPFTLPISPQAK